MPRRFLWLALPAALLSGCALFAGTAPLLPFTRPDVDAVTGVTDSVRYVIHISVDGLRPDAVERLPLSEASGFTRLRRESAWTHNARTDVDYRITLPNHTAQLTGRPVVGANGHEWTVNTDPAPGVTLHSNRGAYVASVFDVVHDHGMATAAYVSKSKFSLFDVSYDADHGAPDTTGADDGRDKIDRYVYEPNTNRLVDRLVADLHSDPAAYTFVHLRDPDAAGHIYTWSVRRGSRYLRAVANADRLIEQILEAVASDERLARRTVVVVTADHGGSGRWHFDDVPLHFTVPFYVWGPGIPVADLYALNPATRENPGAVQVPFSAPRQPIRNGDAANLSLALLGLDAVPGSTIGVPPLRVAPPRADTSAARVGTGG